MQLYFIRHGQSTNNALWDSTSEEKVRVEDPELTDIGKKQAQHLAEYIQRKDSGYTNGGYNWCEERFRVTSMQNNGN